MCYNEFYLFLNQTNRIRDSKIGRCRYKNTGSSHLQSGHILWFFFHADVKMYKTSMFDLEQGFRGCFADGLNLVSSVAKALTETYATPRFFYFYTHAR